MEIRVCQYYAKTMDDTKDRSKDRRAGTFGSNNLLAKRASPTMFQFVCTSRRWSFFDTIINELTPQVVAQSSSVSRVALLLFVNSKASKACQLPGVVGTSKSHLRYHMCFRATSDQWRCRPPNFEKAISTTTYLLSPFFLTDESTSFNCCWWRTTKLSWC